VVRCWAETSSAHLINRNVKRSGTDCSPWRVWCLRYTPSLRISNYSKPGLIAWSGLCTWVLGTPYPRRCGRPILARIRRQVGLWYRKRRPPSTPCQLIWRIKWTWDAGNYGLLPCATTAKSPRSPATKTSWLDQRPWWTRGSCARWLILSIGWDFSPLRSQL